MKKLVITTLAVASLALGAYAQGTITFRNDNLNNVGIVDMTPANWYQGGNVTFQLWILNGSSIPVDINNAASNGLVGPGYAMGQVANLTADGFIQQNAGTAYVANMNASSAGTFNFGDVTLPGVTAHAANVSIAVVAWTGVGAMTASGVHAGVIAFSNPVGDPNGTPPTPAQKLTGWDNLNNNLILQTVPEPSTFALAGLGAAALLIFRRRK